MERRGTNERPIKPADISWNVESKRSDRFTLVKKNDDEIFIYVLSTCICIAFVSVVGSDLGSFIIDAF